MSEPDLATKAPESDAMEHQASMISDQDTKAQARPSMGEHCTTDRPTPAGHEPSGEMTKFDDIEVYISKPADYPNSPGKLLLLLTGGTGVRSSNNQLQADAYAKEGYLVIMPDQFSGDPAPNSSTTEEQSDPSLIEQIKLGLASSVKSFMIDMWLARHTAEKVLPILHKVLDTAIDEYADAVANGGGVYAAGYCFGAKYVIILAGKGSQYSAQKEPTSDEEHGTSVNVPLIKVGAIAHPTLVTTEDLKGVESPLSLACVENDPLFPDEILEFGKKTFASTNVNHEVKMYAGVPHGFAVFGDYDSPKIKDAQTAAFGQMLTWLQSH